MGAQLLALVLHHRLDLLVHRVDLGHAVLLEQRVHVQVQQIGRHLSVKYIFF